MASIATIGKFNSRMTTVPTRLMNLAIMKPAAMAARAVAAKGIGHLNLTGRQMKTLIAQDREMLQQEEIFPYLKPAEFEGQWSTNPLAFKFYNPDLMIPSLGKTMGELMPFANPAWHFATGGTDMFSGMATVLHPWDQMVDPLAQAVVRVRALFEYCSKLGIGNHCYHDGDYVDLTLPIKEAEARFQYLVRVMEAMQNRTGVECGWGTNQLFAIPLYRRGAGSSPYLPAFARACRQSRISLDAAVKLRAKNFVFWGGREGYYDLLTTMTREEKETLAQFLWMNVKHAKKIGFFKNGGKFLIEPKAKEPTSHQYDKEVEVCLAFLKEFGLEEYFAFNVEVNHAILANNTADHEFRMAIDRGMLQGIDLNDGSEHLGWDVDRYAGLRAGLQVGRAVYANGGLKGGVINHDAKLQGWTNPRYPTDMAIATIGAMDAAALGLWLAHFAHEDGQIERLVEDKYASWNTSLGRAIKAGKYSLISLGNSALNMERQGLLIAPPADPFETVRQIDTQLTINLGKLIAEEVQEQGFNIKENGLRQFEDTVVLDAQDGD